MQPKQKKTMKNNRLPITYGQYTDFHQVKSSIQDNSKHYNVIHRHWVWNKNKKISIIITPYFFFKKEYVTKLKEKIPELLEQYESLQTRTVSSWDSMLA